MGELYSNFGRTNVWYLGNVYSNQTDSLGPLAGNLILGRVNLSEHNAIVLKESDIRAIISSNVIDVYQEQGWNQHCPLRDSRCDFGRARGFSIDDYLLVSSM